MVHYQDLDQNPVDRDASAFTLSTNGLDVFYIDNVNDVTTENRTDSLLICREEPVFQACNIGSNSLDSMDKGTLLV